MVQSHVSKEQLIEGLRTSEQQLINSLDAVDAADLESGCYENGWTAREVLAHVASIEWTYSNVLELARKGEATKEGATQAGGGTSGGSITSYNDRQIEKRAQASVADLLAEFRDNRAKTLAAVEGADDSLLAAKVRSAGGVEGPAANVLQGLGVGHVMMHLNDIVTAIRKAS